VDAYEHDGRPAAKQPGQESLGLGPAGDVEL